MTYAIGTFALELAVKATLVLGLPYLVVQIWHRLAAAERHLILSSAILCALALPALSVVTPPTEVGFLTLPNSAQRLVVTGVARNSLGTANETSETQEQVTEATAVGESLPTGTDSSSRSVEPAPGTRIDVMAAIIPVYLAVALALLALFTARTIRLIRHVRGLSPIKDAATLKLVEEMRRELGIWRTVRVLKTAGDRTPWAFGLLHPVVVLPRDFPSWSPEQQQGAVIHELTHIARLDQLTDWMGQLCCALYWIHPLAWLSVIKKNRDAEHACDDRVLLSGVADTGYAQQLLTIANKIYGDARKPIATTAMARPSMVTTRIRSILDTGTRRVKMSKLKTSSIALAGFVLLSPIASLKSQDNEAPATSDELGRVVSSYIDAYQAEPATEVLTEWIFENLTCTYCTTVLRSQGQLLAANTDEQKVLEAAFDIVEERAYAESNGDWLVHLATIALGSGNSEALNRGKHHLYEAFSIGNTGNQAYGAALQYFVEMGRFEDALSLIEQLREDSSLPADDFASLNAWNNYLSAEIIGSELLLRRVIGADEEDSGATEYLPVHKVSPVYPEAAAREEISGNVVVEYTVTATGRTRDMLVVESTDPIFDQVALDSVAEYRYLPRTIGGEAVDVAGVRTRIVFRPPTAH